MSLLNQEYTSRQRDLAQTIFERYMSADPLLSSEYSQYRQRTMLRDILYNLECLDVAVRHDTEEIFLDYVLWMYNLLVTRMTDTSPERIKQQLIQHYQTMIEVLAEDVSESANQRRIILEKAISLTKQGQVPGTPSRRFEKGKYAPLRQAYLQNLLAGDRKSASKEIMDAIEAGVPLKDIYIEVFQEVMWEVGNLWHRNKLTVDKEHLCTAITQGVMAQLYSRIFSTPRNGRRIVACCVGSELHEMGVRTVCDLFELNGWDSVYLGAAVPTDGVLHAVEEHKPDVVALSVTMISYIDNCAEIIETIRRHSNLQATRIAVGGRAFQIASSLPKKWGVITATNGADFVDWAVRFFG